MATYKIRDEDDQNQVMQRSGEAQAAPIAGAQVGPQTGQNKGASDYTKSNFVSGKTLLEKNRDAGNQPDLSKDFLKSAQDRQAALQQKYDAYGKELTDRKQSYATTSDDLNKGIAGDQASYAQLQKAVRGPMEEARDFDEKAGLNIQDINRLNTRSGAEDALRQNMNQRGNYNYTQGQSALDSLLYRQSGVAKDQVAAGLKAKQDTEALYSQRDKEADALRGRTDAEIKGAQDALKKNLSQMGSGITQSASERARLANEQARSAQAINLAGNQFSPQVEALINQMISKNQAAAGANQGVQESVLRKNQAITDRLRQNPSFVDQFIGINEIAGPSYNEEEAARFNRIADLLGQGNVAANRSAPTYNLNQDALTQYLQSQYGNVNAEAQKELEASAARLNAQRNEMMSGMPNHVSGGGARGALGGLLSGLNQGAGVSSTAAGRATEGIGLPTLAAPVHQQAAQAAQSATKNIGDTLTGKKKLKF